MKPPALAQALIAAAAPTHDYEIIAGDLHEEYVGIASSMGTKAANRWYWAQALISIPSFLSYSRWNASALRQISVALIALLVLFGMLAVIAVIETMFQSAHISEYVWICFNYADALVFGGFLAWLVRADGVRITFFASLFLVLCFVVPAVAGHRGSEAPLAGWAVLFGAVPVMCFGAAISQVIRRRVYSSN